jgi:hypothetical protein
VHLCGEVGKLRSDAYSGTIHNCERVFQAGCIIASRIYDVPSVDGVSANVVLKEGLGLSWHNVAVAVCVGNAMALSATGARGRVSARGASREDADAVQRAAQHIIDMCVNLEKNGVKAVPVMELCACLSFI